MVLIKCWPAGIQRLDASSLEWACNFRKSEKLIAGTYDLRLEWQHMLPYDVISKELLVLEWAWIADEDVVPSPSPPQFPRGVGPPLPLP